MHQRFIQVAVSIGLAATLVGTSGLATTGAALAAPGAAGATFLNPSSSTDSPSIRIDPQGGLHLGMAGYFTGINPGDDPTQPGYYAYCPPGADCGQSASWSQVRLGAHVQAAQLQLTPAGQPRIVFETADGSAGGSDTSSYWYGSCDTGCTDAANWSWVDLVDTGTIDGTIWDQTKHSFALDAQGHPRFVYGSGTLVYAACDSACTDTTTDPASGQTVPANWQYATVEQGLYINEPSLALSSTGQPRLVGFAYNPADFSFNVAYLECNAGCTDAGQWTTTTLMPQGSAPLAASLRLDQNDRVGLALSQNNQLWYWQCAGGCSDVANWLWNRFDGLSGDVQDPDLAFDAQNQPHLALRSMGGPFGWGLAMVTCTADCAGTAGAWTGGLLEDSSRLAQDLPQLRPANCTEGGWFGDFRPSLALDAAGNPFVGFDNQFWVAGCSDSVQVRTEFEAVRVVLSGSPSALGQARTAQAARTPVAHLASSHGSGASLGHHPSRHLPHPGHPVQHRPPHGRA